MRYPSTPHKRGNPEGAIVLQIIKSLRARGYEAGKIKTMGVKRGNVFCFDPYLWHGTPDILAFIPELVFIEAKSSVGKQSEAQILFQEFCNKAKIKYILARSIEDVLKNIT